MLPQISKIIKICKRMKEIKIKTNNNNKMTKVFIFPFLIQKIESK